MPSSVPGIFSLPFLHVPSVCAHDAALAWLSKSPIGRHAARHVLARNFDAGVARRTPFNAQHGFDASKGLDHFCSELITPRNGGSAGGPADLACVATTQRSGPVPVYGATAARLLALRARCRLHWPSSAARRWPRATCWTRLARRERRSSRRRPRQSPSRQARHRQLGMQGGPCHTVVVAAWRTARTASARREALPKRRPAGATLRGAPCRQEACPGQGGPVQGQELSCIGVCGIRWRALGHCPCRQRLEEPATQERAGAAGAAPAGTQGQGSLPTAGLLRRWLVLLLSGLSLVR